MVKILKWILSWISWWACVITGGSLSLREGGRRFEKRGRPERDLKRKEFQGIARRDKKALLSEQCKEIEENNRMRKNRDLFKKIRDTKGTFHERWAR